MNRILEWNLLLIRKFGNIFIQKGLSFDNTVKLVQYTGTAAFLSLVFLLISPLDFFRIDDASHYDKPSILYGINKSGDFEPIAEFYRFSKIIVPLSSLAKEHSSETDKKNRVIQAFLSMEDNDFYNHHGIDFKGILRAFFVNIAAGRIKEGASTITQQVARLKFLSSERSVIRKAREAWIAVLMETRFDKNEILEMYLNEIPLGHGTIGIGAASRFYFRKEVSELGWGEAALLSSLTTSPNTYSPLVNPHYSWNKVKVAFSKLVENGKLDIKKGEEEFATFSGYYANLNRSPNDSAFADRLNRFPYFTEYIRKKVIKTMGSRRLYSGGYKIYTTLNIKHQEAAQKAMYPGLKKQTAASGQHAFTDVEAFDRKYGNVYEMISLINDMPDFTVQVSRKRSEFVRTWQEEYRDNFSTINLLSGTDDVGIILDSNYTNAPTEDHLLNVEGSLISIRPDNGYITAMVGGSGFRSDNQQIRSFQAYRQPGSAFKPILYASALEYYKDNPEPEKNITASSLFMDSPVQYLLEDGDFWEPENYSNDYSGFITLRKALTFSKNVIAIRVMEHTGLSSLIPYITRLLQLSREIPQNYSIALGSFEVSPFEITKAYATFANGGRSVTPTSLLYIEDSRGKIYKDYRKNYKSEQLVSEETSFIITSMLQDVIREGTGKSTLSYGPIPNVAGKTGTTNNYRDAWFVGYTPELVASVWIGYDTGTVSLGRGMSGGSVAAPIWGKFMSEALSGEKKKNYPFGNLKLVKKTVCKLSGKLAGSDCTETYEEYYSLPTVPETICNDHSGPDLAPSGTEHLPDKKDPVFSGDDIIE